MYCDGVTKRVAQSDGTFALDGKHGGWQSLAAVLSHAKDQAGTNRGLAQMVAVAPSDGVSSTALLPGTLMGTGLVAAAAEENGYVQPHPDQPKIYAGNYGRPGGGGGTQGAQEATLDGFDEGDMDI